MKNKEEYFLKDEDIATVKGRRIIGRNLLRLTVPTLEGFGLDYGPADNIIELVGKLKKEKGLAEPGK